MFSKWMKRQWQKIQKWGIYKFFFDSTPKVEAPVFTIEFALFVNEKIGASLADETLIYSLVSGHNIRWWDFTIDKLSPIQRTEVFKLLQRIYQQTSIKTLAGIRGKSIYALEMERGLSHETAGWLLSAFYNGDLNMQRQE